MGGAKTVVVPVTEALGRTVPSNKPKRNKNFAKEKSYQRSYEVRVYPMKFRLKRFNLQAFGIGPIYGLQTTSSFHRRLKASKAHGSEVRRENGATEFDV